MCRFLIFFKNVEIYREIQDQLFEWILKLRHEIWGNPFGRAENATIYYSTYFLMKIFLKIMLRTKKLWYWCSIHLQYSGLQQKKRWHPSRKYKFKKKRIKSADLAQIVGGFLFVSVFLFRQEGCPIFLQPRVLTVILFSNSFHSILFRSIFRRTMPLL